MTLAILMAKRPMVSVSDQKTVRSGISGQPLRNLRAEVASCPYRILWRGSKLITLAAATQHIINSKLTIRTFLSRCYDNCCTVAVTIRIVVAVRRVHPFGLGNIRNR